GEGGKQGRRGLGGAGPPKDPPAVPGALGDVLDTGGARRRQALSIGGVAPTRAIGDEVRIWRRAELMPSSESRVLPRRARRQPLHERQADGVGLEREPAGRRVEEVDWGGADLHAHML